MHICEKKLNAYFALPIVCIIRSLRVIKGVNEKLLSKDLTSSVKLDLLARFVVPRLFEEKRRDMVFGFPSFRPSVLPSFRPPIGVCTL